MKRLKRFVITASEFLRRLRFIFLKYVDQTFFCFFDVDFKDYHDDECTNLQIDITDLSLVKIYQKRVQNKDTRHDHLGSIWVR